MFPGRILFFLPFINSLLQINLYQTDWINDNPNNNGLQHHCLYVSSKMSSAQDAYQTISYCMSEWPSTWHLEENHVDQRLTFIQLFQANVTSQQLYLWSTPMDVIERYQYYLNQHSKKSSLGEQFFYNCTLPHFGPLCEYVLNAFKSNQLSLNELIHEFYSNNPYKPTTLTCYEHLECQRGLYPSCLDWSEICDGKIDCFNGGLDEEYCWQLEIHQCDKNEYRCFNGQCIPYGFFRDVNSHFDCLDQSDIYPSWMGASFPNGIGNEPTLRNEDIVCPKMSDYQVTSITSSCVFRRENLLLDAMFSIKPENISESCWIATKCLIHMPSSSNQFCQKLCFNGICEQMIEENCPDIIYVPAVPVLFGHVFLGYEKSTLNYSNSEGAQPTYVCYNAQLLHLPRDLEEFNLTNNTLCRLYQNSILDQKTYPISWVYTHVNPLYKWLQMYTSWITSNSIHCNQSMMYQCLNSSKCISKIRLFDHVQDCFYNDDEDYSQLNKTCPLEYDWNIFHCQTTNECIPRLLVNDHQCHCTPNLYGFCDDENDRGDIHVLSRISFQIICDGFPHLLPVRIDDQDYTDETDCEQWSCNNIYTRCNIFWNCPNGLDELNCYSFPRLPCPPMHHRCASFETKQMMCLPIEKANDGYVDCIGGADEPFLCRLDQFDRSDYQSFLCQNDSYQSCLKSSDICDGFNDCQNQDDEMMCDNIGIFDLSSEFCTNHYISDISRMGFFFCALFINNGGEYQNLVFKLIESQNTGNVITFPKQKQLERSSDDEQRCHRGLDVLIWLDKRKNLTRRTCLCPPSFYGNICQFQNERISLTIRR